MTNEEATQMQELINRDKNLVKQLTNWRNSLNQVLIDDKEHILDQFKAFKEITWCDNMIASINAQLGAYANILNNMKKSIK